MKIRTGFSLAVWLLIGGGCGGDDGNSAHLQAPQPLESSRTGTSWLIGLNTCSSMDVGGGLGGIWWGASWEGVTSNPFMALVSESGEFRLVELPDGLHIKGTFQVSGTDLVSTDAVWVYSSTGRSMAGPARLEGTLGAELGVTGDLTGFGTLGALAPLVFSACNTLYHRPSSLEHLQGTYINPTSMLTIDSTGVLFYQSTSDHCVGNGSVQLLDPAFNMYRVEVEVESCTSDLTSERNGLTFTGLAYVGSSGLKPDDVFVFSVSAEGVDILGVPRFAAWNLGLRR